MLQAPAGVDGWRETTGIALVELGALFAGAASGMSLVPALDGYVFEYDVVDPAANNHWARIPPATIIELGAIQLRSLTNFRVWFEANTRFAQHAAQALIYHH